MGRLLLILAMGLFITTSLCAQGDFLAAKSVGLKNADARALIADRGDIYLATRNALYRSASANGQWQSVFYIPPGENEITCLAGLARAIFVGTRRGLFRSSDQGGRWQNIFRMIVPSRSNILCIASASRASGEIIIGTEAGIFISRDLGKSWKNISGVLKNKPVSCVALFRDSIYAGGDFGVYVKKDMARSWERILIKSPAENAEDSDESVGTTDEVEENNNDGVTFIGAIGNRIYAAFGRRITYSEDGAEWQDLPTAGLSGIVADLTIPNASQALYCATTKGVFKFSGEMSRWSEVYSGLEKRTNVRRIIADEEEKGKLWAVTDKGLYMLEDGRYGPGNCVDVEQSLKTFAIVSTGEPTYMQLQQAAIRFCDVSPEKIASWQRQSRMKALLPKVSFGTDEGRSTNAEIYTSATREYVTVGPDDISRGWDVSVSWELGDLIWSTDQTSIDVRSRLTTQLRNDILDDLRRLYYERKRVQFELVTQPPQDAKSRFDKEMRLEELTHAIDDLTGSYLTGHMKKPDR